MREPQRVSRCEGRPVFDADEFVTAFDSGLDVRAPPNPLFAQSATHACWRLAPLKRPAVQLCDICSPPDDLHRLRCLFPLPRPDPSKTTLSSWLKSRKTLFGFTINQKKRVRVEQVSKQTANKKSSRTENGKNT